MPTYTKTLVFLLFIVAACGRDDAPDRPKTTNEQGSITSQQDIVFSDVRSRTASKGGTGAVYFTLTNGSSVSDTLTGVDSEIAELTEIHKSFIEENGSVKMRNISSLVLDTDEQVNFKPGGYHVMLIRMQESLSPGDTVNLEVSFAKSGTHNIAAPVVQDPSSNIP